MGGTSNNRTVRLFKVIWQGQELSREAVVKVLGQVLEPVGVVQGDLAVDSEMFESRGVRANGGEKVLGTGGGMYVPLLLNNLQQDSTTCNRSAEEKAQMLERWGGVRPDGSEELGPGQGVQFWDCPAGYFTVGVPMLMADRREVVHNLCVQMSWQTLESVEEPEKLGFLAGDWYVEGVDVRKREELQMVRTMAALGTGIRLVLRPEYVNGEKLQMICGLGPVNKKMAIQHAIKQLREGVMIEWKNEQRMLKTGDPALVLEQKQEWSKKSGAISHRKEREDTDGRKLVIKPLAKSCSGQACADRMLKQLEVMGVEGAETIGFSPDKNPELNRRGVVGFVVFETTEQMQAAEKEQKACWALLGTEFQLLNRPMWCVAKDPDRNVALDRREAKQTGAAKRLRGAERSGGVWGQRGLPKPLGKEAAPGGSTGAGGSTSQQGGGDSRPVIEDEAGRPMDRGGEEAIREMDELAKDQLMEQLGKQINELFTGLVKKQEEDNRKLREENEDIRKQMMQQNSRLEELMTVMLTKMGEVQPVSPGSPLSTEVTPEKGRRCVMPVMPSTQQRQVRAGALAKQDKQAAGDSDNQEVAELRRRNQAMENALRCVMSTDESTGMMQKFMQEKGHSEVVGIITAGGAMPSVTK